MTVLKNEIPVQIIKGGHYTLKPSGAMNIQTKLKDSAAFSTVKDGALTAADDGVVIYLSPCQIQIEGAGSATLVMERTEG